MRLCGNDRTNVIRVKAIKLSDLIDTLEFDSSDYFKDTAARLGLLERWFQYREDAMKELVTNWAQVNDVVFEDDIRGRKG